MSVLHADDRKDIEDTLCPEVIIKIEQFIRKVNNFNDKNEHGVNIELTVCGESPVIWR